MGEIEILGISTFYGDRIFVPAEVVRRLKVKDRLGLKLVGRKVVVLPEGEIRLGKNGKFYPPRWLVEHLQLRVGCKVIYLKEGAGEITLSKLEDRLK